ncbi:MAG TPA: ABC transporter permease [Pseudonocardiaceae bacterium]|jgi:simple sugar transport system permease protein|nr:ABC transporter permease [Pseudonocardiaceae bacterium]
MSSTLTTDQPSSAVPTPPTSQLARRSGLRRFLGRPEVGSLVGTVLVIVFFVIIAPPIRHGDSISTVLYQSSTIGIVAVGVALLMIGGEFDLSAGVAVITSSLTASMIAYQLGLNVWAGVLIALVVSLGIGAFNGWLLNRTGLPSFLVTLATFLMLQGINLAVTKLVTGNVATNDISDMQGFSSAKAVFASTVDIGGVAVSVLVFWWIAFVVVATWVLLRTRAGNWIFAVGGKQDSARAVGVPVRRTKVALFMVVGFCAWFSGMQQLFAYNTVQSGQGVGMELIYIAAAVVGGCLLTGGYGSVIGSALGALIFGVVQQGIVFADWNPDWFKFFLGAVLLLATLVNMYVRYQANRR